MGAGLGFHPGSCTRMGNEFLYLLRIPWVNGVDFIPVPVKDNAARQLVSGFVVIDLWICAVVHDTQAAEAAAPELVFVETGNGDDIWDVDILVKGDHFINAGFYKVQALHIQWRTGCKITIHIDGAGDAAYQIVRVRVFTAEYRVNFHKLFLQIQCFQVVSDSHEVGFRWQFVSGVIPVTVFKRSQLAGLDKTADTGLHIAEIAGAGFGV